MNIPIDTMSSNIVLFASEISVICELNPYQKYHNTFLQVWKRTNPLQIKNVEKEISCELKSRDELIGQLVGQIDMDGTLSKLVNEVNNASTIHQVENSTKYIESAVTSILEDCGKCLDSTDLISKIDSKDLKKDIAKTIESQMNKKFGTRQESSALSSYEKKHSATITNRNDKFHSKYIGNIEGCSIIVGGKVDGIKEDGTVIEVKNRMRRFFDPLPKYDIAQLQTYLFILDSDKGELVEQLKGRDSDIKTTIIDRDSHMWNTVLRPKIMVFCEMLHHFMEDHNLQKRFVTGNDSDRERLIKEIR